jgi:glycosyltransferase involved in cell wall biosynthesis
MRVLVLTNNPERASFRQRVTVYRDILADHGIRTEVAVLPRGMLARRRLFRQARDFDGVLLHKKKLNFCDARELRRRARRILYNFDDAIMRSAARPDSYSRAHFVPFRRTVRLADMVITCSEYLAEQARPFNTNVQILPIGLQLSDYGVESLPPADGKIRLVWIGSKSTLDYLRQLEPVFAHLAGRFDRVVLRVIGDEFPEGSPLPLEKIPWSPEARRIGLATADIGLAPLPDNPFTRGKATFKVLEYSASSLPVVAAPVGTNAEYILEGTTGFLAAGEGAWIAQLTRLVADGELRKRMGQAGRRHAAQFDIGVLGVRFAGLIRKCFETDPAPIERNQR